MREIEEQTTNNGHTPQTTETLYLVLYKVLDNIELNELGRITIGDFYNHDRGPYLVSHFKNNIPQKLNAQEAASLTKTINFLANVLVNPAANFYLYSGLYHFIFTENRQFPKPTTEKFPKNKYMNLFPNNPPTVIIQKEQYKFNPNPVCDTPSSDISSSGSRQVRFYHGPTNL